MALLETVDDASTAYLEITFLDEDGAPFTPTTITYRIDLEDGTEIKSNTSVSPNSTVTITLTKDDNKNISGEDQINIVTIKATWSTDKQLIAEYRYMVKYLPERNHLYT